MFFKILVDKFKRGFLFKLLVFWERELLLIELGLEMVVFEMIYSSERRYCQGFVIRKCIYKLRRNNIKIKVYI